MELEEGEILTHRYPAEFAALFQAAIAVECRYFDVPTASAPDSIYRERVYCYELYHQWRTRWPQDSSYSLSGEVDKSGHPLIRKNVKPDLLVHIPGTMDNLLAMEVKPGSRRLVGLQKDLKTLTYFRNALGPSENYRHAYLWIYGISEREWMSLRQRLISNLEDEELVAIQLVVPVIHPAPGEPAQTMEWS